MTPAQPDSAFFKCSFLQIWGDSLITNATSDHVQTWKMNEREGGKRDAIDVIEIHLICSSGRKAPISYVHL